MNRKEIVSSQDYKATKVALCWYPTLTDEERENMDVVDAYADGVIYGWNNPHWIPVEERLPDEEQVVLVYTKRGTVSTACYTAKLFNAYNVTHWMPIVPPRKEE